MSAKPNVGGRRVRCADGLIRTMTDATFSFRAIITPEDNDDAVCGDPERCVIARAVERTLTKQYRRQVQVTVGSDKAWVVVGDEVLRFQIPRNEAALLKHFDNTAVGFPPGFSIELVPVPPAERLGARSKKRGRKEGGDHKAKPDGRKNALTAQATDRPRSLPTRHVRAPRYVESE